MRSNLHSPFHWNWTLNARKLAILSGRCGGLMVTVLTIHSDDPSSNHAKVYIFLCKVVWKMRPKLVCQYFKKINSNKVLTILYFIFTFSRSVFLSLSLSLSQSKAKLNILVKCLSSFCQGRKKIVAHLKSRSSLILGHLLFCPRLFSLCSICQRMPLKTMAISCAVLCCALPRNISRNSEF